MNGERTCDCAGVCFSAGNVDHSEPVLPEEVDDDWGEGVLIGADSELA